MDFSIFSTKVCEKKLVDLFVRLKCGQHVLKSNLVVKRNITGMSQK